MLDSLSTRLQTIFDKLGGRGRLSEENIQEALREVRVALLEADVNFKVVRAFIDRVKEKAVGQDVLTSLTPAQQVVKVVHTELVELLGGSGHRLAPAPPPPSVLLGEGRAGPGKPPQGAKAPPPLHQAGPAPDAGGGRHPAAGGHGSAPDARRPARRTRNGAARADAAADLPCRPRRSGEPRAHTADPRHRPPPAHRRGPAGPAATT